MSPKANGTDAKDVALYFMRATGVERVTPAIIAKTIAQVKNILKSGYTKEEIIAVIDYVVEKGVRMYSIGYVSHAINDVLEEIEEKKLQEEAKNVAAKLEEEQARKRSEVKNDGETTARNQDKARRLGVQSGKREKFNFDLFEK
jgi:hypothetical protein